MQAEIQAIIEKNLPEEVGRNLKKVLAKAEEDANRLVACDREIHNLTEKISKLKEFEHTEDTIKARIKALDEREENVRILETQIELIQSQAAGAEQRTRDLKEIVMAVFANNHFKYDRTTNKQIPLQDSNGYSTGTACETKTETVEGQN